eukprot:CAMPEP_0198430166 /NCGR_PEP_ID=MMETSP1452-20131203/11984_1 /TAXON_ID=1181717 /ORGANISM="Synchroma pusillum, Strain CCMP3072" /LENGTH=60 /DNA_ID=CAMNT_0044150597 /DNA_START=8 /DNA_END=187 /DNA_ORIENTATION=-
MSAARLQLVWGEAGDEAPGAALLVEQLGLSQHDAREVARVLAQRAEAETALQAMADFLRG